ncbi:MAG: LysM peptidoglycan-binding domain-containing protein [Acidaminococcus sp.]|uniref:LysM peptidoglycan-binding domain-containing protein n=1 Tax=Acidaminococcus intestini TaxID=187327 RepID=A0A943EH85_9FIRM|nr:LysM peptidoglycan-binding domain-containing protein [Acidaminococcus sp.]MBS5520134.1 LysM peptidoglycan-binding domain-containing protein [Acidaminococcus intestini]MDY2738324.1 LysM peptidoglycan-binding domain-containing protein [Acidaminococcus sp.]
MKQILKVIVIVTIASITIGGWFTKEERAKPSEYLTFEGVVYTGDSLWSVCEKYAPYEDMQTIIQRVREDNNFKDPGALQPGQKNMIRVKKL